MTRQFLPGYFQPPLPGLDRGYRQDVSMLCKTTNALKVFSVTENAFYEMGSSKLAKLQGVPLAIACFETKANCN
jgi:hypothetical protein